MKRYSMYIDEAEEKPDGEWVKAEEALAMEASLDMADRAGLELAKQLEVAEREYQIANDAHFDARVRAECAESKVERCKAVLSRRYSEPGHWENPNGELCSADELEAALEDE